jgi:hypothetical protein
VLGTLTNATLANETGMTACAAPPGRSYVNFAPGGLSAGSSASVVLDFSDPTNQGITYTTDVLAGPLMR